MAKRRGGTDVIARLYVGIDDSNHASKSKAELIVATFSRNPNDFSVRPFPNRRKYSLVEEWAQQGGEYLMTFLTAEKYRHNHSNLPLIAPRLIAEYLKQNNLFVAELYCGCDGPLPPGGRNEIQGRLKESGLVREVHAKGYIKKQRDGKKTIKHPHCPPLVYYADCIANGLAEKTFTDLSDNPQLVPLGL